MVFLAAMIGAAVGAALAKRAITVHSPSARERAEHAQAVALARDLLLTPDALELRDRARHIVDRADARTNNRKDS